jgi:hypothetical protein
MPLLLHANVLLELCKVNLETIENRAPMAGKRCHPYSFGNFLIGGDPR